MIGIVDYGVGNLFSLYSSLKYIGADAALVSDKNDLAACSRIILPGVGAFGDAAKKLAADFGITGQKPSILAKLQRGASQAETERRSFRVLGDYLQILQDWKAHCAPQSPEDAIDPRYAEACHMLERIENMLDILTCGTPKERAEVVTDLQKDNRLALMEARNRQIRRVEDGTK